MKVIVYFALIIMVILIFTGLAQYSTLTDAFIDQGEDPYALFSIIIVLSIILFTAIVSITRGK